MHKGPQTARFNAPMRATISEEWPKLIELHARFPAGCGYHQPHCSDVLCGFEVIVGRVKTAIDGTRFAKSADDVAR